VDLNAEQIGSYIMVLSLIWDRGGPIPDDEGWLARRMGVARLKWRALRSQLIKLGKITIETDPAGRDWITNRRAMQEVRRVREISEKRAAAANIRHGNPDLFDAETAENGHSGDAIASNSGGLPDETAEFSHSGDAHAQNGRAAPDRKPPAKPPEKKGGNTEKNRGGMSPKNPAKSLNSNNQGDAHAQIPSRARAREQELDKDKDSNGRPNAHASARAREAPPGEPVYDLALACAEAAGMAGRFASRPALVTQSVEIVQGWIAAGVDIREQAVPWIAEAADRSDEPAHSLAKFAAMIDTRHAKAKRQRDKLGRSPLPTPDATPLFEFADEAPPIRPFRQSLAKALPHGTYARLCNHVRFAVMDWRSEGDGQFLEVTPRVRNGWQATDPASTLEQLHGDKLRGIARKVLGSELVAVRLPKAPDRSCASASGNGP
jgi:uncharacterized protein YdaU (DUF1376 family)